MLKKSLVFPILLVALHFNAITSYAEESQEPQLNIEEIIQTDDIQNSNNEDTQQEDEENEEVQSDENIPDTTVDSSVNNETEISEAVSNSTIETVDTEAVSNPTDLDPIIKQYCQEAAQEFDVNEYVLESLIFTESRGDSDAKNGKFIGLTQLNPKYFTSVMETLNITDPYDPRSNIRICAYKLAEWSDKYNIYLSLDCWHNGETGAVTRNKVQGTKYSKTIYANAILLATTDTISNPNMEDTEKIENVTNNKNI